MKIHVIGKHQFLALKMVIIILGKKKINLGLYKLSKIV
jgi:hypothetical protein